MPSEQQWVFSGYLLGVLSNGARHFRYRGRVHALLGVPEREGGNPVFPLTLPPVGFRYEFRCGSYLFSQLFPHEAVHSASDDELAFELEGSQDDVWGEVQPDASRSPELSEYPQASIETSGAHATGHSSIQERLPGGDIALSNIHTRRRGVGAGSERQKVFTEPAGRSKGPGTGVGRADAEMLIAPAKGSTQRHTAGAELRRQEVSTESTEKPKGPDTGIKRASVEIPGVSERCMVFPALRPMEQEDTSLDAIETRPQPEEASAGSRGDIVGISPPEVQGNAPALDTVSASPHTPEKLRPGMTIPSVGSEEEAELTPAQSRKALAPRPATADVAARPNRGAADRIEHLRHAVHQLAAKVSSQPAAGEEVQPRHAEPLPASPVRPIVIVRQPVHHSGTPRAFWARSYLSHFRLRALR
jgi:hypothetical protein